MTEAKVFNFVFFCVLCSMFSSITYYIKLMHLKDIRMESEKKQKIELDLKDAITTKISYVQDDNDKQKLIEIKDSIL